MFTSDGVLPDDDSLGLVYGAVVECRENLGAGRIDHVMLRLLLQKFVFNLFEIRLLELVGEQVQPGLFKFYGHSFFASMAIFSPRKRV